MVKKHLTTDQRAALIYAVARGRPRREIAAEMGVSERTVYNIHERFLATRSLVRGPNRGRVGKMGPRELQRLKQHVDNNFFQTLEEIKENLGLPVSRSCLSKHLKKMDRSAYISPRKFHISLANREDRVQTAARRQRWWTREYVQNIVFTDESGIDNSGRQRRYVRRPKGMRDDPKYTYHFPNRSLKRRNFFAWISYYGVGALYFYERMNSESYCWIVEDMVKDLREWFEHDRFKIVHDNAKFHTSNYTREYFGPRGIDRYFTYHPTYSPDMNLIENPWGQLKREVKNAIFNNGQIRDGEAYDALIEEKWYSIPLEYVQSLYDSYFRRMEAIVRSGGYLTKY